MYKKDIDLIIVDFKNNCGYGLFYDLKTDDAPVLVKKYSDINEIKSTDIVLYWTSHTNYIKEDFVVKKSVKSKYHNSIAKIYEDFQSFETKEDYLKRAKKDHKDLKNLLNIQNKLNMKSNVDVELLENIYKLLKNNEYINSNNRNLIELHLSNKLFKTLDLEKVQKTLNQIVKQLSKEMGVYFPKISIKSNKDLKYKQANIFFDNIAIDNFIIDDTFNKKNKAYIYKQIKEYAHMIISKQDIVSLLNELSIKHSYLVNEVLQLTDYKTILRVCQDLLKENVPIANIRLIIESIVSIAEYTNSPEVLLEYVRSKLFREITDIYLAKKTNIVSIVTLTPEYETYIVSKLEEQDGISVLILDASETNHLIKSLHLTFQKLDSNTILVVNPQIRLRVFELCEKYDLNIPVVSHNELDMKANFEILSEISDEVV
ncbi:MAG: FHIPEP family type III secretion protein [Campylobacterota bacterium]|nr:FHIPEP family type III secretion protein [Campylobacterota bacterium]